MSWSKTDFVTAFDMEAGDIATLAAEAQKIQWFNEGQSRLGQFKRDFTDIVWSAGNRSIDLPADFASLAHIVTASGVQSEAWRVWGQTLILTDPEGASGDGTARLYYYAEPAPMTTLTTATELTTAQDVAVMYYALHRFYKKLSSNRAFYKRYATLVGQNAVSLGDLQQESDRYYQDFLDSREDLVPEEPAFFYGE